LEYINVESFERTIGDGKGIGMRRLLADFAISCKLMFFNRIDIIEFEKLS
jgi:hypothetical protein